MFFCAIMSANVYSQYPLHRHGQINRWVTAEPWLEAGTAELQNPLFKYAEPWPGSLLLRPPEHWALTLLCFSSDSAQQLSWASAHLSACTCFHPLSGGGPGHLRLPHSKLEACDLGDMGEPHTDQSWPLLLAVSRSSEACRVAANGQSLRCHTEAPAWGS